MANRRMIAKTIVESDAFVDMPATTRLLYYDLNIRADDDGFVNAPKKILRETGASNDDIGLLVAKKFIIPFESGIVVIKHWKIHNYIQADRYTETKYKKEKAELTLDENKSYTKPLENEHFEPCTQNGYSLDTQVRLGKSKDRLGKDSIEGLQPTKNIIPPTEEMVTEYCKERGNLIDPNQFYDFYETKGWKVGKDKMKDWQACIRTWEKRNTKGGNSFIGILSEYED